jgi:hypothetical protein
VEAKHVPPLETLIKNIVCLALATRSGGTPPLAAIVRHPAENFIRNHFHIRFQHKPDIPKTEHSNPSMQCFYIADAGEGGILFQLSGCTRCPPSPAPHPPKAQIFTDRLRSHCCGNLLSQISRPE